MYKFLKTKTKHNGKNQGICYKIKNSSKAWNILAVILVCFLGLVYLLETNSIATKGFQIKGLEQNIADLRERNKKLELDITELQSTEKIQQRVDQLGMVTTENIDYIRVGGPVVAVK